MKPSSSLTIVIALSSYCLWSSSAAIADDPPPMLAKLCDEYRELKLPAPPKGVKLIRYEKQSFEKKTEKYTCLSLLVQARPKPERQSIFSGFETLDCGFFDYTEIEPVPASIRGVKLHRDDTLVLAIQCELLGWSDLAHYLYARNLNDKTVNLQHELDWAASFYWSRKLTHPTADRTPIAAALRRVCSRDVELDKYYKRVLRSLELSLVPSDATPGSVESLIDSLIDECEEKEDVPCSPGLYPSERRVRLMALGFDAIPALIDHLEDERLTRMQMRGFNNLRDWNMSVCDAVGDIIEGFYERRFRPGLAVIAGERIKRDDAKAWWESAKKVGEENYLMKNVFVPPRDKGEKAEDDTPEGQLAYVKDAMWVRLAAKYPNRVREVYRKLLDLPHDQVQASRLPRLLELSGMNRDLMTQILAEALKNKNCTHRGAILKTFYAIDAKRVDPLLIDVFNRFPKNIDSYVCCDEVAVVEQTLNSANPEVWKALEKATQRAVPGLRLMLLCGPIDQFFYGPKRDWSQYYRYLSAFLDDATVCDFSKFPEFGHWVVCDYKTIEVRNFAALQLARCFKVEVPTNHDRTDDQWREIRERMRKLIQ